MAGEFERLLIRIEADTAVLRKAMLDAEKQVAGFSSSVDKNLERSERRFNSFNAAGKRLFAGISAAYLIRETAELADAYTNMTNRLKFVTSSSAELEAVQRRLFEIAQETRQPLQDTTELYSRMAFALRDAGVSQNQVLQFTENLNKALTLSGAAGAEASGALVQLSQGLASGTLRGQELNSVLEQTPFVAELIAKQLGITTGELRKWGEQGKITGRQVFDAIAGASDQLDSKFGKTVPTISQGFTTLGNSLLNFVGDADKASGASTTLAKALQAVAKGIDDVNASSAIKKLRKDPLAATPLGIFRDALVKPDQGLGGWDATVTPNLDATGPNKQTPANKLTSTEKQIEQLRIQALEAQNLSTEALQAQYDLELQGWQDMLSQKLISQQQFEQARANLQTVSNRRIMDSQMQLADAMLSQTIATGSAIFGENKKWAIAEATISTAQGVAKALGAFPPPFNFAMAALVAAQGFAQVAAIRSTSAGGGSGGSAGVGGAGSSASTAGSNGGGSSGGESSQSVNAGRAIHISLVGRTYDREQVRELIEGLNEAIADGAVLRVA